MPLVLLLVLAPAPARRPQPCATAPQRLEKTIVKGGASAVFYGCGPTRAPGGQERYRKAVLVRTPASTLAWLSPATPMRPLYPLSLDNLWRTRAGTLISIAVQHGGRTLDLFLLRERLGQLAVVREWRGVAGARVSRLAGRLVVRVGNYDRSELPQLWYLSEGRFHRAGRANPRLFRSLGAEYASAIERASRPSSVAYFCNLAALAYRCAGVPAAGLSACRLALGRLRSGRGLAADLPNEGERQRRNDLARAEQEIKKVLEAPSQHRR